MGECGLIWDWSNHKGLTPILFRTRREARKWNRDHYDYLAGYGGKMPKVVKVNCSFEVE